MSEISDSHVCGVKGKVIFKAPCLLSFTLILLYTIVGILGCKNVNKVSDTLIFRYNEDASVSTLDPAFVKSQSELWITSQIFNGLVELDSNLMPIPMIAKKWSIENNGLTYRFTLRNDVQFHGQERVGFKQARWVTAHDVVYSFQRLLNPETASPGAWIFSDKVNLPKSHNLLDSNAAFYAPNDSVFVLKLKKPFAAMLSLLATAYCYIVPKEFVEDAKFQFARNPIGTGPFYLKLWEEDVKLVLRKNAHYFEKEQGKPLPYLEAVNVDFIKNKQTAFMRFVAGEYDFFNGLEGSFKDELLSNKGELKPAFIGKIQLINKPFLNTEYLGFWVDSDLEKVDALQNPHFRKALNLAVDRAAIVRYLRNGMGYPAHAGFVPPVLNSKVVEGYCYSPTKAKEALKLAGYPLGKGAPVLSLTTTADYLDMAVYVKKYWENIGIKVNIEVLTGGMLRQTRNKGKLPIFRGSWIADYADAENYLACFYSKNHSPSGPNYTHYQSDKFDALYEAIVAELDFAKRQQLIYEADSLLMNDAPLLVLYYDKSIRLFQNHVHGLKNDVTNRLVLKRVWKSQ